MEKKNLLPMFFVYKWGKTWDAQTKTKNKVSDFKISQLKMGLSTSVHISKNC